MSDRFVVPEPSDTAYAAYQRLPLRGGFEEVTRRNIHEAMKVDVPAIVRQEVIRALLQTAPGDPYYTDRAGYVAARFGEPEKRDEPMCTEKGAFNGTFYPTCTKPYGHTDAHQQLNGPEWPNACSRCGK